MASASLPIRGHRPGLCWTILLLSLALVSLPPKQLLGQIVGGGGLTGTVVDATGAVVVGAKVVATNTATGVTSRAVTTSAGGFSLTSLQPGQYTVAVDAESFKSAVETGVAIEISRIATLTVMLTRGAATETTQVTASAQTLETESPEIGTTIEPQLVGNAPIEISGLARQIDSFIFLAPGVQGNNGGHYINGGVTFENEILFNGIPIAQVQYQGNQTNINPPFEMVNEFRVSRATFSSQYGLGQGAVTYNMASGANRLHGDAFEILRNQLFDSAGFLPTRFGSNGKAVPPINQQHDYGFTVSGPVVLPRLYNGHDRTFFLVSSDWFRQNQAVTGVGTVPTAAMKKGDFSGYVDANGNQIPIYDPQTGAPFPGNVIDPSRFSMVSKSLLPSIPDPDRPGLQFNKGPAVPSTPIRQNLWGYTLDHTLTPAQSLHFSQWRNTYSQPIFSQAPIVSSSNPLGSQYAQTRLGSGFLLNYVNAIRPNLVATAGAAWIGEILKSDNAQNGYTFAGVSGGSTLPSIGFDGQFAPSNWGAWGNYQGGLTRSDSRGLGISIVNNWLWTKGRHTLNIGGEFRRTYQNALSCIQCGGTFYFSQRTTSTPDANDASFGSYGSSFASFLLGQADSAYRIFAQPVKLRNKAISPYIQDDFKVSKRLTVNVGLRWDVMVPFTENQNQIVYADPSRPDPGAGNLPGGATKFGHCPACAGLERASIHWKNFGPRVGVSYALNGRTVVQGGYYIAYLDGGAYEYGTDQTAFYYSAPLFGQFNRNSTNTSSPGYGSWDTAPLPNPGTTAFSPSVSNGNVIQAFDPKASGRAPYNQTWTFSLQRQLPWNLFVDLAYVGNRSLHLPSTLQLPNQPDPALLKYGPLLGEAVNSPDAVAAGIKIPYPEFIAQFGQSATVEQALSPYPQYAGYFNNYELDGTSFYNALQTQVQKRFTGGLSFLYTLTLARNNANVATGSAIFASNALNRFNLAPEFGPSNLDQFYNTKFVATYELPFGPGKRYLNSNNWTRLLAGGWQVGTILDYEGGFPFGPYEAAYNPLITNGFDRPNVVPGKSIKTFSYKRSKDYFTGRTSVQPVQFTTDAFSLTSAFELGDSKRAYAELRSPPLRTEAFNAIKRFQLTERLNATLRVDYFNAFNRTQLYGPDNNINSSTFGQVTYPASQLSNRQGQATFRIEF